MKEYIRDLKCFHKKHWRTEIGINLAVLFVAYLVKEMAERQEES